MTRSGMSSVTVEPCGEVRVRVRVLSGSRTRQEARAGKRSGSGGAANLSNANYSENFEVKPGFGGFPKSSQFRSSARRSVKNACAAMEKLYGRRVVFATFTLAGSTQEARSTLARFSAKAVELIRHWIAYRAPNACYCYVWERQKSGALHMHWAIACHDVKQLRRLERGFKRYSVRIHNTISELSGVEMTEREDGTNWRDNEKVRRSNCVPVRKSIRRYLAKYLSKGTTDGDLSPSRWWGQSRELALAVAELRICRVWLVSDWDWHVTWQAQIQSWFDAQDLKYVSWSEPFSRTNKTVCAFLPSERHADMQAALLKWLA